MILGMITFRSIYKININHNDKLLLVSKKNIEEQARKCYNDKKCTKSVVTLQELEDLNYLNNEFNPVTKEYYNKKSYVKKENDTYIFVIIE